MKIYESNVNFGAIQLPPNEEDNDTPDELTAIIQDYSKTCGAREDLMDRPYCEEMLRIIDSWDMKYCSSTSKMRIMMIIIYKSLHPFMNDLTVQEFFCVNSIGQMRRDIQLALYCTKHVTQEYLASQDIRKAKFGRYDDSHERTMNILTGLIKSLTLRGDLVKSSDWFIVWMTWVDAGNLVMGAFSGERVIEHYVGLPGYVIANHAVSMLKYLLDAMKYKSSIIRILIKSRLK